MSHSELKMFLEEKKRVADLALKSPSHHSLLDSITEKPERDSKKLVFKYLIFSNLLIIENSHLRKTKFQNQNLR